MRLKFETRIKKKKIKKKIYTIYYNFINLSTLFIVCHVIFVTLNYYKIYRV